MMDKNVKILGEELRKMNSDQAADWLMRQYALESPDWGGALDLIPHRSWARPDQIRLGRYYLSRLPFASAKPYKVFSGIMSFKNFVAIIRECLPKDGGRIDLLIYYLGPVLDEAAKTDEDRELAKSFINKLRE